METDEKGKEKKGKNDRMRKKKNQNSKMLIGKEKNREAKRKERCAGRQKNKRDRSLARLENMFMVKGKRCFKILSPQIRQ